MKKLVADCQTKVEKVLNYPENIRDQGDRQALFALQEGLVVCISKVPSKQGFPFDLPDVEYVSKLILSNSFLEEALQYFNRTNIEESLYFSIQETKQVLNEFLDSGIQNNIREIKILNTNFVKLRKILDDEDSGSRQIKKKITLFNRQLKKHQIRHPKLKIIQKRVKKYWNNLFHCYDDNQIPRTNLEIERSFNLLKRIVRKRSGVKNRPTFFSHEGKVLVQIENITSDYSTDISEIRFINEFKAKILQVDNEKLKNQSIIREKDKSFLKKIYQKKISVLEAGLQFKEFKAHF